MTALLQWFQGWPPEVVTMIVAALPIVEVRGAVPLALEVLGLPAWRGALAAFVGSALPAVVLPLVLERFEAPCRRYLPVCRRLFDWTGAHVERRYTERYRALGFIGLALFVAVPLPMTGVWTGALAAWILRMEKRYAIPALILGTGMATIVVTLATLGVFGAMHILET